MEWFLYDKGNIVRFFKYVWPFFNIMHERVKENIQINFYAKLTFSSVSLYTKLQKYALCMQKYFIYKDMSLYFSEYRFKGAFLLWHRMLPQFFKTHV